jgi:hypothetical protein
MAGFIGNQERPEVDFEGRIPRVDWLFGWFHRLHIRAMAKEYGCRKTLKRRHSDCNDV